MNKNITAHKLCIVNLIDYMNNIGMDKKNVIEIINLCREISLTNQYLYNIISDIEYQMSCEKHDIIENIYIQDDLCKIKSFFT